MEKIAYLGMGTMGRGMAGNLLDAGHPLTVWNRTPDRCQPLVEQGAEQAHSPAEAAGHADVVMYCLANDDAVKEVVFAEDGVLEGVSHGQVVIDMSTVHPDLSRREAAAFGEREVAFLDAPVFGSKDEAREAGLWIVVGGPDDVFERLRPIFERLSETIHYMGQVGAGTSMKLVGNLLVAAQLESLGEAMLLATRADLDLDAVLDVLKVTDFRSPIINSIAPMLLERDFSTSFALKHLLKDANLIARFAEDLNVPTPGAAATREVVKAAINQGWGDENASAMIRALEQQAGTTIERSSS